MHFILAILIFAMMIVAAVVIVGGWVLVTVARGMKRLIFGRPAPAKAQPTLIAVNNVICARADCDAENPPQAIFCRRCGEPLRARTPVRSRRVA